MEENYLTLGFNKFLTKEKKQDEILEDEASLNIESTLGTRAYAGNSIASNGLMTINWNDNLITVSDKARERLYIGYIKEEGKYGIRVVDSEGSPQLDETYT